MKLLDFLVATRISESVGWTLVHSLWEGLIVAAVLSVLLVSVRSPRIRYMAGCAALLTMLAGLFATLVHFLPESNNGVRTLIEMTLPPNSETTAMRDSDGRFPDLATLIPWLAPCWLIGVCLFYLRYTAGWLSLCRMRRRGVCNAPNSQRLVTRLAAELRISRPVVLLESLLTDAPMVLGHIRPAVLVPLGFLAGLPPDHVEAILLHELAHISRADYFMNICQRLIEGLLFYHPAVWWISRVVRTERENCCDDIVVAMRGDAHTYAEALASLEQNRLEQNWLASKPAVAATGGNLMKRVKRLLYPNGPSGIWAPAPAAVVLMAGTAVVLSAWHANPNPSAAFERKAAKVDNPWHKWVNEDVVYIISDEEKAAFENLQTDDERQKFVEEFWVRREARGGPKKEEHYRRIAYANEHFASGKPGWQTDRGRSYIKFGPPDEIDSHPQGGNYERPEAEGGGQAVTYPFEQWVYYHFEGVGSLTIEFVDKEMSGDFRMTLDRKEKYKKP